MVRYYSAQRFIQLEIRRHYTVMCMLLSQYDHYSDLVLVTWLLFIYYWRMEMSCESIRCLIINQSNLSCDNYGNIRSVKVTYLRCYLLCFFFGFPTFHYAYTQEKHRCQVHVQGSHSWQVHYVCLVFDVL